MNGLIKINNNLKAYYFMSIAPHDSKISST